MRGDSDNMFAIVNSLVRSKQYFSITVGLKNLKKLKDKNIFFIASRVYALSSKESHNEQIMKIYKLINKQNTLCPSFHEMRFWENKEYMYEQFSKLSINHPKLLTTEELANKHNIQYPIIFKPNYGSGSQGIVELLNDTELNTFKDSNNVSGVYQERIEMKKDLRVIMIEDKIHLHYWRINNNKTWNPTSTSHGSTVDFHSFPLKWKENIVQTMNKLNLKTGAFDICWAGDDLDTPPIYLEVSPIYLPNPPLPMEFNNIPYSKFKQKLFGKLGYSKSYVKVLNKLTYITTMSYLNELNNEL